MDQYAKNMAKKILIIPSAGLLMPIPKYGKCMFLSGNFFSFIFFLDKKERKNQEKTKLSARKQPAHARRFFRPARIGPLKATISGFQKKNLTSWFFYATLQSQSFYETSSI